MVMSPDEAHHLRMYHYMHNGMLGCVKMGISACRRVIDTPSSTDRSKELAAKIRPLLDELYESLKERKPYNADSQ